jgi:arsenate reductase (glutaredoxin)
VKLRLYGYTGCDACRRAVKFLQEQQVAFDFIPIREQPPTRQELTRMLACHAGNVRRLCNTAGLDYRRLKLGAKLADLDAGEALDLLAGNGNLIKRPFVLTAEGGWVGFNEDEWRRRLGL